MKTTKSWLMMLAMLFPFSLMAKNVKLRPGYYINQQSDTVKCNIELRDWSKNPAVVEAVGSNGPLELKPEETRGFGVYGLVEYTSAKVTYHSAPITGTNSGEKFSDKMETAWCFLKLLSKGNVELYELKTNERIVFFISDHGGPLSELVYRVARKDNQLVEDHQYQQTLLGLFIKEGMGTKYEEQIARTEYKENEMLSLMKLLNGSSNKVLYKKSGGIEPIVFAGGIAYFFPSHFAGIYSSQNHFPTSVSPLIGLGINYNLSPYSGKFKTGLSAVYSSYKVSEDRSGVKGKFFSQNFYDTTAYKEHTFGSNSFVSLNLFLTYVLNPEAKVNYFLKAGMWYSFSVKSNSSVYTDYKTTNIATANGLPPTTSQGSGEKAIIAVPKSFGNILFGAGVIFGRSQVGADYDLPSFTGRFNGTGTKFKIGTLSVAYGYSFGRKH